MQQAGSVAVMWKVMFYRYQMTYGMRKGTTLRLILKYVKLEMI